MTRWDEMCAQIAKRFNVTEADIADVLAFGKTSAPKVRSDLIFGLTSALCARRR
jgi:hypothetical protein